MSTFYRILGPVLLLFLAVPSCRAQEAAPNISIQVHADQPDGLMIPIWNYFGYDEPNYTYSTNGKKLLGELAALSPAPVYVRVHNLLTSGEGTASLKWGSTNVYTEDAAGKSVYSWQILDRIFDTFHGAGIKPLVEIGFMPEALSTHPQPYRHNFPQGSVFTGWAYPPKDYQKWSEIVFQFVRHLRERYGDAEVKTWLWEVWNEPDIAYWQGTPEEFSKLYDYSVDAVLRAFPEARVGGPDSTGPSYPKAAQFLRNFLEHCAHQRNYATGKTGSRLDFIAFHPKGSPIWQGDHVVMGIARQLASIEAGFKVVKSFAEWRNTPIILGESDPEGCAACSARSNPQNGYRNGALYAAYTAEQLNATYALAAREEVRLAGSVSWSFEFEDQPYFEGFRELSTNGVDKPVLNAFRMFGLLGTERVKAFSTGKLPTEQVVSAGVRQQPDISAIATRKNQEVEIMIWNYHDEDVDFPAAPIDLSITGLPDSAHLALVEHFRIDAHHSNAFTAWKQMKSPQSPSPEQYEELQTAGQLQLLCSPAWIPIERGGARLHFILPRQALSLVRITW
ncbi:MAG TPA: beta-xylosidase [Candidatus Angelobacter sp.]|nr:beta-xylosidase [Candidatus Angelobacter sp.]